MSKDFERLTDDVIEFICEHGIAVVKFREEVEPEDFAGIDAYVGFGREHAKELIALIAKGPLPGEQFRFPWSVVEQEDDWVALQSITRFTVKHGDIITNRAGLGIALSPESHGDPRP